MSDMDTIHGYILLYFVFMIFTIGLMTFFTLIHYFVIEGIRARFSRDKVE